MKIEKVLDWNEAYAIEITGYPEDEAATLEKLQYRIQNASDYFWGLFDEGKLVGYVCGTLSSETQLSHESMSHHDPNGTTLCIHSVCVRPDCQRKGYGLILLKEYIKIIKSQGHVKLITLLSHENLINFYEQAGFKLIGESPVHHGQLPWFECSLTL